MPDFLLICQEEGSFFPMHLSHSGNWMKKQKISFERFKCELWDLGKANIFEVKNIYGFSGDWQIITQPSLFQLSGH